MKVFDSVPVKKPAKNVFNLSHDVKASYNFDKIYPFLCQPIYPGDTFNCRAEVFMRAMPMLAPVMHNVDMHVYFVFVPDRLIWNEDKKDDFKIFITGGEKGTSDPVLPYWTYQKLAVEGASGTGKELQHGSLVDHMGFPSIGRNEVIGLGKIDRISALPFRAYQFTWNELFRNQNLQNEIDFSYGSGELSDADYANLFSFRKKCWEKDYFTSALPFLQRGEPVKLPISYDPDSSVITTAPVRVTSLENITDPEKLGTPLSVVATTSSGKRGVGFDSESGIVGDSIALTGTATIDGSRLAFTGLSIGTINDFRYCLRLQQWLENNARCGSRYIEQLFSHFGVVSSDARLQRPELLGGGKIPLIFTDVEQTSYGEGTSDNVLGDLGGKGTLYGKTGGFKKYFEEHGILLGLLTIIPRTSYSQGINRAWTAFHRTDWYFPEFAHLGEQAILNKEIYYNPADPAPSLQDPDLGPDGVFGYQGRFTELRYIPSSVHGEMRDSLQYWHFGRLFDQLPRLNSSFVEADSRVNVFALEDISASDYDPFVCQIHLDIKAVRPMPKYAVPTL